ncbi:hypothetical protein [Niabella soli]|uniref:FHA domain-containing protein n=1 Tax=Niabella soli DSM 19437 TaxID=929713 RepID=W0F759_9BACT|nr:hypothetical protein [Niabella soli]AHF17289.1 hypothetical protein NIASO_05270 [Niabella soli DSM 19437]
MRIDNIEELKEITLGAISNTIRMLGYGDAVVTGLVFHSAYKDNAVENVSLATLIKDGNYINRIKREFKSRGIQYKEDLLLELVHESPYADKVTVITEGIGVEVLTPKESLRKIKARVVATEGILWEPEYILEPTGKHYFIGRCKDPKIENGPKIHNDIAFVGIEEKAEPQYKINNFISRSHAMIVFDKEIGAYKIYRSRFLNNPSHKIKIFNTSLDDFTGVSLGNAAVPHILKNGDSICFNDTVVLEFYLLP